MRTTSAFGKAAWRAPESFRIACPRCSSADEVFVVEGEKDADVLVKQAGRVATCNPLALASGARNSLST